MESIERKTKPGRIRSGLGDGPIAFLDIPDARSGKIKRKLVKVVPDNQIKGRDMKYGHTAYRFNGCDISGALDKNLIFSRPQSKPSVPVELSEH